MEQQAMRGRVLLVLGFVLTTVVADAGATTALEYVGRAQEHLDAGNERAALIELKNALQQDPHAARARLLLGRTYLALGDADGAAKELERARELGMDASAWAIPLAQAYLDQREPQKLLDDVVLGEDHATALHARLYALRGQAQALMGESALAQQEMAKALELAAEDPTVLLGAARLGLAIGDREAASGHIEKALVHAPGNAVAWTLQGELLRTNGRLDEAMLAYAKAVELDPKAHRARLSKAAGHIVREEYEAAQVELRALPNELIPARYLRGQLALHKRDLDTAASHLEIVLRAWPNHLGSHLALGTTYYTKGRIEAAEQHLSRYSRAVPQNVAAGKLLAAVRLSAGDPGGAIEVLNVARKQSADDPQVLALLGNAYLQQGDHSRSTAYLEQAAALVPDAGALHKQLAVAHLAGGDAETALAQLTTAVELDPKLWRAEMLRILVQLRQRDFDAALAAAQMLIEKYPASPAPHHLTALAQIGKQNPIKARQHWERAVALASDFFVAEVNLAQLDIQSGDLAAAERRYQKMLDRQPGQTDALLGLAALAQRRGEAARSLELVEQAWNSDPSGLRPGLLLVARYRAQGNSDRALVIARELERRHPDHRGVLYNLGVVQFEAGYSANAIRTFEKLARLQPNTARGHALLGRAYLRVDRAADARASFSEALELQHDNTEAHVGLAVVDLKSQRVDSALEHARALQRLHPEMALGYQLEGDVHNVAGETGQAVAAYQQAVKKGPNGTNVMSLYGAHRRAGDRDEATRVLERWLARAPEDSRARWALASDYHSQGRTAEAIVEYEALRQALPDNALVWNNLAWLYYVTHDPRSLSYAEKAYTLDPKRPEILDTYGWMQLRLGDSEQGLTLIRKAASYAPHNTEIRYHLAVGLHEVGRVSDARLELEWLLRSHREFPERSAAIELLEKLSLPEQG